MDNFSDKKLLQQRINAPEGMYEQIRHRIVKKRIRIAKTRRELAIGSALLLIIGGVNIGTILFSSSEKPQIKNNNTEQILYETYFDNQTPFLK